MITMPHIQETLDRLFPGVKLRYNPGEARWILTDQFTYPEGVPALSVSSKPTAMLRGCVGDVQVNEGVICIFEDPETKIGGQPHLDLILGQLNLMFHGNRHDEINRRVDRMEIEEDFAKQLPKREQKAAMRDAAERAWHQSRGRVVSTKEGYTDPRKVQRDINRRAREEAEADAALNQAVLEEARAGRAFISYPGSQFKE